MFEKTIAKLREELVGATDEKAAELNKAIEVLSGATGDEVSEGPVARSLETVCRALDRYVETVGGACLALVEIPGGRINLEDPREPESLRDMFSDDGDGVSLSGDLVLSPNVPQPHKHMAVRLVRFRSLITREADAVIMREAYESGQGEFDGEAPPEHPEEARDIE